MITFASEIRNSSEDNLKEKAMTKAEHYSKKLLSVYYLLNNAIKETAGHKELDGVRELLEEAKERSFGLLNTNNEAQAVYTKIVGLISEFVQTHGGYQPTKLHVKVFNLSLGEEYPTTILWLNDGVFRTCKSFEELRRWCDVNCATKECNFYITSVVSVE